MLGYTWTCNSSNAFWHIYKHGEKVGSPKKRFQAALGALFGEAEKQPRCLKHRPKAGQEISKWRRKASGRGDGRIVVSTTLLC